MLPRVLARSLSGLGIVATTKLAHCGTSKHAAASHSGNEEARAKQYEEAIAWCKANGKGGWAGANRVTDKGQDFWPLVKSSSLDERLKGRVDNSDPHAARKALTPQEEADVVETCKILNRHGQGVDRKKLGELVIESLKLRPVLNAGRKYTPLNHNAQQIIAAGAPQDDFFTRFFADHTDITEKVAASEEMLRIKWMTQAVSELHFTRLADTLKEAGILMDDGMLSDARRVLNSDECPNPWQGKGGRTKLVAAVGEPCKKFVHAARDHTTLDVAEEPRRGHIEADARRADARAEGEARRRRRDGGVGSSAVARADGQEHGADGSAACSRPCTASAGPRQDPATARAGRRRLVARGRSDAAQASREAGTHEERAPESRLGAD